MKELVCLWLIFWICQMYFRNANAVPQRTYGISDLLKPQVGHQINLRIPDYYYEQVPKLSPVLTGSL